eukprot:3670565-Pleurochrysis_carterae.AAC.6
MGRVIRMKPNARARRAVCLSKHPLKYHSINNTPRCADDSNYDFRAPYSSLFGPAGSYVKMTK